MSITNPRNIPCRFFVVMGVSGSGKSTVGKALAESLGWDFYDGDDVHPPANLAKMAAGIPLDDVDRIPWLNRPHDLIAACLNENRPGVLACSALKQRYREILLKDNADAYFVYLKGDYASILARISIRTGHYMKPEMLASQFAALEEPANAIVVDVKLAPQQVVEIVANLYIMPPVTNCASPLDKKRNL